MTPRQQLDQFLLDHSDIEIFEVILHDLNGNHRGKWLPTEQIKKLFDGGYKMAQTACSLDSWGRDIEALVAETGDTDGVCTPHADTLCRVPWAQGTRHRVCLLYTSPSPRDGLLSRMPSSA